MQPVGSRCKQRIKPWHMRIYPVAARLNLQMWYSLNLLHIAH